MDSSGSNNSSGRSSGALSLPSITVPKGGGAIKNLGEKYQVNALTGTLSFAIPLPFAPSRGGSQPQIALTYDSAQGNNIFGLGWNVPIPSIARKTSKQLPQYKDEDDSDTFLLSGAEDLVPALEQASDGTWQRIVREEGEYKIYSYRPRIEGLFATIERFVKKDGSDMYWKSVTQQNVTNIYGQSDDARIFNPDDPTQIFQWLLEKTYDAKGNIIVHRYKRENDEGVDVSKSFEVNRMLYGSPFANCYLKEIRYGNKVAGDDSAFHFRVVFDYGEHDASTPLPDDTGAWDSRSDPFSFFNSGFEIRTYRLCKRVLLFHDFDVLGSDPVLVRSMDFEYDQSERFTFLTSVTQKGYAKQDDGSYSVKSFPPLELSYTSAELNNEVKTISLETLSNLPFGVDGQNIQWVDLDGEGLTGMLSEQADGWFYFRNRGNGEFAAVEQILSRPSPSTMGDTQPVLADIDNDGRRELTLNGLVSGYFMRDEGNWESFIPFSKIPNVDLSDPNTKLVDLNGDGLAEILVSEDEVFTWYESLGKEGFGQSTFVRKGTNEETGPTIVFADGEQSIYVADMTGDGLFDIVRIRNGEVCFWPSLGYGRFGAKVVMENPPQFDEPDLFDQRRIRLADLDGSGPTDILYLGDRIKLWYNQSGNSFSDAQVVDAFPDFDLLTGVSVMDILGSGTSCLVWSSPHAKDTGRQVQYIDLLNSTKPHLLSSINNNLGVLTSFQMTSSTKFYLEDENNGTPWITKLHFPVHVLERVELVDEISGSQLTTQYAYHHGYYDNDEQEFRGFGMVEQWDTEAFETYKEGESLDLPPVYSKSWFHTGAYVKQEVISKQYANEYFAEDSAAHTMPDSTVEEEASMSFQDLREALRALKGNLLRQEVYSLDGSDVESKPYTVTETNYVVRQLQPREDNLFAVFFARTGETLTYNYERNEDDPRINHAFVLEVDDYGHVLKTVTVSYPRRDSAEGVTEEQQQLYALASIAEYFNETEEFYLLGVPLETKTFELNGLEPDEGKYFTRDGLATQLDGVFEDENVLLVNEEFSGGFQAQLRSWMRNYYRKDEIEALPFGEVSALALPHHNEGTAFPVSYVSDVFGDKVTDSMLEEAGYAQNDDHWWNKGATVYYKGASEFYLPYKLTDPFNAETAITYDAYSLAITGSSDALGNTTSMEIDYRTLHPTRVVDINGNTSEFLADEFGMVIATSVYGTEEGEEKGDTPLESYVVQTVSNIADVVSDPSAYLQEATSFFHYNFDAWMNDRKAPHFISLLREKHVSDLVEGEESPIQIHLGYSDGLGRSLQQKVKVEAGRAFVTGEDGSITEEEVENRWLVSGRTVYNNKEKPVKQYEPFYSGTYEYEDEEELNEYGVTPVIYYDPLGRVIKTETAKGFLSKVEFNPWEMRTYDENDTVLESSYYQENSTRFGSTDFASEEDALVKAAEHSETPAVQQFDSLGRAFLTTLYREKDVLLQSYSEFDINGKPLSVTDPRQYASNAVRTEEEQVKSFEYDYDMAGAVLRMQSVDAGERWTLTNAMGKPLHVWNARGYHSETEYDALQRPLKTWVDLNGEDIRLVEQIEYGETAANAEDNNLRGRVVTHYDQAGKTELDSYSLAGKPLRKTETRRTGYKEEVNWEGSEELASESFESEYTYDALSRTTRIAKPDGSVTEHTFHQSGALKSVQVTLKNASGPTTFVESITYNAKGQRETIVYGNGVQTNYEYESTTFRLLHLTTTRQEEDGSTTTLQNLEYTYDPVGNITRLRDSSFETVFSNSQIVEPVCDYTYDALYQLTEASGREHPGLLPDDYADAEYKQSRFINTNDTQQLQNYTQRYTYDDAGNLTELSHTASDSSRSYTRTISVAERCNRGIDFEPESGKSVDDYFDANGNMLKLQHLSSMEWNDRDLISSAVVVERESGNDDAEYYVYNSAGIRARKVHETYDADGNLSEKIEKIYLDGVEIKRIYKGASESKVLDRSSLHVMDDVRRIAIVHFWEQDDSNRETDTIGEHRTHYQFTNHLGSAYLELNESAEFINYEEYFPFGGTSFIAAASEKEISLKEYRYNGKECDDATSLYYYGARYYASWMGRWISVEPKVGKYPSLSQFIFNANNPIRLIDPSGLDPEESLEQQAKRQFEEHLVKEKIPYATEVNFRVVVDGEVVDGVADFAIYNETQGKWELKEFKGQTTSPLTPAQEKYIPALKKGAEFEVTGISALHGGKNPGDIPMSYKSTGGFATVYYATVDDFKKALIGIKRTTVINKTQGYRVSTVRRASTGELISRQKTNLLMGFVVGSVVFLSTDASAAEAYLPQATVLYEAYEEDVRKKDENFSTLTQAAAQLTFEAAFWWAAFRLMGAPALFLTMESDRPQSAREEPTCADEMVDCDVDWDTDTDTDVEEETLDVLIIDEENQMAY